MKKMFFTLAAVAFLVSSFSVFAYAEGIVSSFGIARELKQVYPRPEALWWLGSGAGKVDERGVLVINPRGAVNPEGKRDPNYGWFRIYVGEPLDLKKGFEFAVDVGMVRWNPTGVPADSWHSILSFMAVQYDEKFKRDMEKGKYGGLDPSTICYADLNVNAEGVLQCKKDAFYAPHLYLKNQPLMAPVDLTQRRSTKMWDPKLRVRLSGKYQECQDRGFGPTLAMELAIDTDRDGKPDSKLSSMVLQSPIRDKVVAGLRADFMVGEELSNPLLRQFAPGETIC